MNLKELVGSKVYVKQRFGGEHQGRILSVPVVAEFSDIEASVSASTFLIGLESGGTVETSGYNLTRIDHEGYIRESARSGSMIF
jgi:hypothetical protein